MGALLWKSFYEQILIYNFQSENVCKHKDLFTLRIKHPSAQYTFYLCVFVCISMFMYMFCRLEVLSILFYVFSSSDGRKKNRNKGNEEIIHFTS